eukprot:gene17027-23319_t
MLAKLEGRWKWLRRLPVRPGCAVRQVGRSVQLDRGHDRPLHRRRGQWFDPARPAATWDRGGSWPGFCGSRLARLSAVLPTLHQHYSTSRRSHRSPARPYRSIPSQRDTVALPAPLCTRTPANLKRGNRHAPAWTRADF